MRRWAVNELDGLLREFGPSDVLRAIGSLMEVDSARVRARGTPDLASQIQRAARCVKAAAQEVDDIMLGKD